MPVPEAARTATVPPVRVETNKLAEGIYYLTGGSHHSVAVEFRDFMALIEAPQDERRTLAVIEAVYKAIPNKPIRYVVNSHHHFDHLGGLRTAFHEGATIVTHRAIAILQAGSAVVRTVDAGAGPAVALSADGVRRRVPARDRWR